MNPRLQLALDLAREASRSIRAAAARSSHTLSEKSANDFATDTDKAVEAAIALRIAGVFPGDCLLGEEGGERLLGAAPASGVRWIVDPLDGTYNFIHGFPYFATSIAIEIDGQISAGVVADPTREALYFAERGGGAWLQQADGSKVRLSVSAADSLGHALVGSVLPSGASAAFERVLPAWLDVARAAGSIRRTGAAALDLAQVAAGRLDGFFVMSLGPWDAAAGALLVTEAGGHVCDFSGEHHFLDTHQVIAGSSAICENLVRVLLPYAVHGSR